MISLFLDTATDYRTIALLKDNEVWKLRQGNKDDLSGQILSEMESLFVEARINPEQIDRIYIVIGPGSFTGIRIGLTIAKVYAWALKKVLIPISSLEVLSTTPTSADYIIPAIDARRGYVYGAIYDKAGKTIIEEQYILLKELLQQVPKNKTYTIVSYDILNTENQMMPEINLNKLVQKHADDSGVEVHTLKPNYLKKTEAEENLQKQSNEVK